MCGYIGICKESSTRDQTHSQIHEEFEKNRTKEKKINPQTIHECGTCEEKFKKEEQLKKHRKEQHPEPKCFQCELSFPTNESLLQHIADFHNHIQGVPKKIGINDLVWFIMIWLIPIVLYGLDPNPGNSHQSLSDPGLVRVRLNTKTLRCLRCCQIRTAWCHFTLPFHMG